MPFVLIKGTFHVTGYAPDGDSLKFRANQLANWTRLDGRAAGRNSRNHVQLRFEGIDTPETHYKGHHQPRLLADQATDDAMRMAGIRNVVWSANRYRVRSADDGTPGYILSRTTERFGRPVAFVFAGNINRVDGSTQFLDPAWLRQSLNYRLIRSGAAYPAYYDGLFADLRETLSSGVLAAYAGGRGVWPYDWSGGVRITSQADLDDVYVVFPKLYRRLTEYLSTHPSVTGFKTWLERKRERMLMLRTGNITHFDTVIEQSGHTITMTEWPEDLVFLT